MRCLTVVLIILSGCGFSITNLAIEHCQKECEDRHLGGSYSESKTPWRTKDVTTELNCRCLRNQAEIKGRPYVD